MTAVLDLPADLSEFDFGINCEKCDKPAVVMLKGCADREHVAFCGEHLAEVRRWFDSCKPAVCSVCYRPFMHFDTHYHVQDI